MLTQKVCGKCGEVMMLTYRPSTFWSDEWVLCWFCHSCKSMIPVPEEPADIFGGNNAVQSDLD